MSGFNDFFELKKNGSSLSAAETEELREELETRERGKNIFPLEVFHDALKPFITVLNQKFDIPRAYIGLSLLTAYSSAIGSSYAVSPNGHSKIYLPVWGCLPGISSSGKSLSIDMVFDPIYKIQAEFDQQWNDLPEDSRDGAPMKTVLYRDVHAVTLMRSVMPDNPKGVLKYADEILEWINGMNSLSKKEGTDEQFWLSAWNCKDYSGIRAGKDKFVIPRPFVNVIGGIQPTIMYKLFAKDRDTTGFIFRLLFAVPDQVKIAEPDPSYWMDENVLKTHTEAIRRLYFDLQVEDPYNDPGLCLISQDSMKLYDEWVKKKIRIINRMDDLAEKEIHSGILGKIKEYALRFCGILHLVDKVLNMDSYEFRDPYQNVERITSEVMLRSLKLAEYFYNSAAEAYEIVQTKVTAPADVLLAATIMRGGLGKSSYEKIAQVLYGDGNRFRQKAYRNVKKWIKEYPKVFGAEARSR